VPDTLNKIDVLDHGFVRLVDYMGSDLSVVRAARVSYDADWRAGEDQGSDAKLINYLWKNHHTSPFEAVSLTFEVKAPIFVFRQWHRHRTWSYNELSARYRELPEEFYVPALDVMAKQSTTNKQGRSDEVVSLDWASTQIGKIQESCAASFDTYKELLVMGVARELARSVLPVNTYSHMFASVNLLNLFRFLTLRCHEHAQHEIRVYAQAMLELTKSVVPVCAAAWEKDHKHG
jgi:thymidylate synthase (FAD)